MSTRLDTLIGKIKDPDVRVILGICCDTRKYPKDCITEGGVEKLASYIVRLESSNVDRGK